MSLRVRCRPRCWLRSLTTLSAVRGRRTAAIGAPPPTAPVAAPVPVAAVPLTGRNFPDIGDSWKFPSVGSAARLTLRQPAHRGRHRHGQHVTHRTPSRRTVLAATAGAAAGPGAPPAGPRRPPRPDRDRTAARAHLPDEPGGEGRPALRDAGVRPLRHRPRPGGRRRQPQGDRGPHRRRADRQVPRRRHHLLRLGAQHPRPAPDRRPLQRHPAGRARRSRAGCPLLISTDQEHGIVARVGKPATLLPGGDGAGRGRLARPTPATAAGSPGAELAAMGIRQNYAPVADVNVNPANPVIGVRSFGSDPRAVAGAGRRRRSQGYQGAGVAATAKHFPGHGDTNVDSHTGLPVITHTREQWEKLDAPPFRAAVAAGIDSIMTAHIVVPALDPSEDPATLSRPILTGILREELGYDGVVVTDSLGMEGVRTKYGDDRVPVLALKAGVDQLLNPPDLDVAWNAVLHGGAGGRAHRGPPRRIDPADPAAEGEAAACSATPYVTQARASTARSASRAISPPPTGSPSGRRRCWPTRGGCCRCPAARTPRSWWSGPTRPPPPARPARPTAVLARRPEDWASRPRRCRRARPRRRRRSPRRSRRPRARTRWSSARTTSRRAAPRRTLVERPRGDRRPGVTLAIRNPYDIAQLPVRAALRSPPTPGRTSNCGPPPG